jgi:hypothetical protein
LIVLNNFYGDGKVIEYIDSTTSTEMVRLLSTLTVLNNSYGNGKVIQYIDELNNFYGDSKGLSILPVLGNFFGDDKVRDYIGCNQQLEEVQP